MDLTDQRLKRLTQVAQYRQRDLTVILENVHDRHNIGAILRTCDSVGIHEVFIIYTEDRLTEENNIEPGKTSSSGSDKWIKINLYRDVKSCFAEVKKRYDKIWATALTEQAENLYSLDLTNSVALLFGNESEGLSEEAVSMADGNFIIPQVGFVRSLNISVACAISVYEAHRQRSILLKDNDSNKAWKENLIEEYKSIHAETKILKRHERFRNRMNKSKSSGKGTTS